MIDIELLRTTLIKINENANNLTPYYVMGDLIEDGYDVEFVFSQLKIYQEFDLFNRPFHETDGGFCVFGLSVKGYNLMLKLQNDAQWEKQYSNFCKKGKISKFFEEVAACIGIAAGEFMKHKNGD